MKEDIKTLGFMGLITTFWWAFILILGILGTVIYLWLWPYFNSMWLKGFHSTNEYNTAKISLIYTLVEQYYKNAVKISELKSNPDNTDTIAAIEGQQNTIITRIKREVKLLDAANSPVPDDIRTFLNHHR